MRLEKDVLRRIRGHAEQSYPEEGAGFLLGVDQGTRKVLDILPLPNARDGAARVNRYLITPEDYLRAEQAAESQALELLGVFHSHPDHPSSPSEYDLEWAQPGFSYLITSVSSGQAADSKSWRLREDRSGFFEEALEMG